MILAGLLLSLMQQPTGAVVFILDDVAAADLELYGGPVSMPTLTALAAQGVKFTRAYANPSCAPSRRSMMTGEWWRTATSCDEDDLLSGAISLPDALPDTVAGYFGKWHLGGAGCSPLNHGFETWLSGLRGNVGSCGGADYWNWQRVTGNASACQELPSTAYEPKDCRNAFKLWWDPGRLAIVATNLAHSPFHRPPADLLPPNYPETTTQRSQYEAMIRAADDILGDVLADIDLSSTLVFVVGDNGTPPNVSPAPSKAKGTVFERGVRVPLIVAGGPVCCAGRSENDLVHLVDLYATVIQALGVSPPASDSISLLPALQNVSPRPAAHDALYLGNGGERGAISQAGIKLRQVNLDADPQWEIQELFDLATDPSESINRYSDPSYADRLADMKTWIDAAEPGN